MKEQLTLDWRHPFGSNGGGVSDKFYELSITKRDDKTKRFGLTFRDADVIRVLGDRIVFAVYGDTLYLKGHPGGYTMSKGGSKSRAANRYVQVRGAQSEGLDAFIGDYEELKYDKRNNCFYVRSMDAENKNKSE